MPMHIQPLVDGVAARITGLDLREALDAQTVDAITTAWHQFPVLTFAAQDLSTTQQVDFALNFGEPVTNRGHRPYPESHVTYVSNRKVEGHHALLPRGGMDLHSDWCYRERPCKATMLFALETTPGSGATVFASTQRAYASLPVEVQRTLVHLVAENMYDRTTPVRRPDEDPVSGAGYVHPAVIKHPATGSAMLFVNRLMTRRVRGLADEEKSVQLLDLLLAHIEAHEHLYVHEWNVGDLVMWDNLAAQHGRRDFTDADSRVLRRISLEGSRPEAADPVF